MQEKLAQTLAQIHSEFGIYDRDIFSVSDAQNIIYRISSTPELAYLYQFYMDYRREYLTESQKRPDSRSTPKLTDVSTTVDFPFLGEAVIEAGQAKYMFVFQGSLARPEVLSCPVLSCLWPLDQRLLPGDIFQSFWTGRRHAYDYIYKCLGLNSVIAKHSYVTDAVRIGKLDGTQDRQQNRQLLQREIEQLNPELVVLVGSHAVATVGDKIQREHSSLYFNVPYPTKRRSIADVEKANRKYDELQGRW